MEINETKQQETTNGKEKPKEQEKAMSTSKSYVILDGEIEIGSKSNHMDNIVEGVEERTINSKKKGGGNPSIPNG